jgi:CPA2 family monovalent cation:H+ antiporter-2
MADALLIKTLVVILASVSAISLVARARLPAAAGYLLAGLVIGPHGLQLIATSDETRFLAELGIIFLMFMVGLEFSLSAMIAARRDVFGAGSLQVGFTVLMVAGLAMLGGIGLPTAVLLGGAVAMSSTAITLSNWSTRATSAATKAVSCWASCSFRTSRPCHFLLCSVDGN